MDWQRRLALDKPGQDSSVRLALAAAQIRSWPLESLCVRRACAELLRLRQKSQRVHRAARNGPALDHAGTSWLRVQPAWSSIALGFGAATGSIRRRGAAAFAGCPLPF